MWSDPAAVMATTALRWTDVACVGGAVTRVLGPDPTRVAFGIVPNGASTVQIYGGPWTDPQNFGLTFQNGRGTTWVNLFEYGPVVCGEWYVHCDFGTTLRVAETYMLEGW